MSSWLNKKKSNDNLSISGEKKKVESVSNNVITKSLKNCMVSYLVKIPMDAKFSQSLVYVIRVLSHRHLPTNNV